MPGALEEMMKDMPQDVPQNVPQQATALPMEQPTSPAPTGGGALAPLEQTEEGGNTGYNGKVEAFGRTIEVRNGVAKWDNEKFFISDDGSMVIDEQDMIVGRIENGQFIEADDAYIEQLRGQGMVEGG